jgi:hypothetical protein
LANVLGVEKLQKDKEELLDFIEKKELQLQKENDELRDLIDTKNLEILKMNK